MARSRSEIETLRQALAHAEEREQHFEQRAHYYEAQMQALQAQLGMALSTEFPPPPVFEADTRRHEQEQHKATGIIEEKPRGPQSFESYMGRGTRFTPRTGSRPVTTPSSLYASRTSGR